MAEVKLTDHLHLRDSFQSKPKDDIVEKLVKFSQNVICPICQDVMFTPCITSCGHDFCYSCLNEWFQRNPEETKCPTCREPVTQRPSISHNMRSLVSLLVESSISPTIQEMKAKADEEYAEVMRDHNNLFPELFNDAPRLAALFDADDRVTRCPYCTWELEPESLDSRICGHCRRRISWRDMQENGHVRVFWSSDDENDAEEDEDEENEEEEEEEDGDDEDGEGNENLRQGIRNFETFRRRNYYPREDDEELDEFVVPDGYLSGGEGVSEDNDEWNRTYRQYRRAFAELSDEDDDDEDDEDDLDADLDVDQLDAELALLYSDTSDYPSDEYISPEEGPGGNSDRDDDDDDDDDVMVMRPTRRHNAPLISDDDEDAEDERNERNNHNDDNESENSDPETSRFNPASRDRLITTLRRMARAHDDRSPMPTAPDTPPPPYSLSTMASATAAAAAATAVSQYAATQRQAERGRRGSRIGSASTGQTASSSTSTSQQQPPPQSSSSSSGTSQTTATTSHPPTYSAAVTQALAGGYSGGHGAIPRPVFTAPIRWQSNRLPYPDYDGSSTRRDEHQSLRQVQRQVQRPLQQQQPQQPQQQLRQPPLQFQQQQHTQRPERHQFRHQYQLMSQNPTQRPNPSNRQETMVATNRPAPATGPPFNEQQTLIPFGHPLSMPSVTLPLTRAAASGSGQSLVAISPERPLVAGPPIPPQIPLDFEPERPQQIHQQPASQPTRQNLNSIARQTHQQHQPPRQQQNVLSASAAASASARTQMRHDRASATSARRQARDTRRRRIVMDEEEDADERNIGRSGANTGLSRPGTAPAAAPRHEVNAFSFRDMPLALTYDVHGYLGGPSPTEGADAPSSASSSSQSRPSTSSASGSGSQSLGFSVMSRRGDNEPDSDEEQENLEYEDENDEAEHGHSRRDRGRRHKFFSSRLRSRH